jgi:hypothetical protein
MLLADLLREREELRAEREARAARRAARAAEKQAVSVAPSPNAYEQKKAARVERMRARAEKKRAEAKGAEDRSRTIADRIPFGQPILLGHHSQRRHERDIQRIRGGFDQAVRLSREADVLERRAAYAETNRAVSSDDPEAIAKLRAKLAAIEAGRERWKRINVAIRKGGAPADVLARLVELGIDESTGRKLIAPDFAGRKGIPAYKFANASAEARRIQQRIAALTKKADEDGRTEQVGDVRISQAENRVRIHFPSIPPEPTRKALKGAGFRWSPTEKAWQRHASNHAWYEARRIVGAATP